MFAALPPGKYIFRVKAATQKGFWGQENSIVFSILAPWWQRTWFYLICGVCVGAILYGIYRFRINQLRKLYLIRSKISQDLHDEVGATLTSISFLSEVASNQASSGDQAARQTLHKIGEFSREMIGEMNDIVWAINPANDKFGKITDRIRNFALPLLSAKNIQFILEADAGLSHVSLNMQQRKNLYLIFKEALNNAAKYADCSKINVNIIRENNHIRLDIIDDGKGFVESEIVAGNGLTNIRHRAKEIKADVHIRSRHREGTSVILSMPITQNT
jgi:signal transduction histidine kinase